MQKLNYGILLKITEKQLTSNELNLLLHICLFQDDYACIKGIYYKEHSCNS